MRNRGDAAVRQATADLASGLAIGALARLRRPRPDCRGDAFVACQRLTFCVLDFGRRPLGGSDAGSSRISNVGLLIATR